MNIGAHERLRGVDVGPAQRRGASARSRCSSSSLGVARSRSSGGASIGCEEAGSRIVSVEDLAWLCPFDVCAFSGVRA